MLNKSMTSVSWLVSWSVVVGQWSVKSVSCYVSISKYLQITYTFLMFQSPSPASEQHL